MTSRKQNRRRKKQQ